jgi:hypothetical protein
VDDWPGLTAVDEAWERLDVQTIKPHHGLLYLDLEANHHCVLILNKLQAGKPTGAQETLLIEMVAGEETHTAASSLFEALLLENQTRKRSPVAVQGSTLHVWMQQRLRGEDAGPADAEAEAAFGRGTLLAPDFEKANEAQVQKRVLTATTVLVDPRPPVLSGLPADFVHARRQLHALLSRMLRESQQSDVEELDLWTLCEMEDRRATLTAFVEAYRQWQQRNPEQAGWYEAYALFLPNPQKTALNTVPTAALLSPLHPLRLAWMSHAQWLLRQAIEADAHCPFAAVLDTSTVPDCLTLSCATGTGVAEDVAMLSLTTSSDYWAVFWNAEKVDTLRGSPAVEVLHKLGVEVEGLSNGLAEGQLRRAMGDLETLACAQPLLRLSISSKEAGSQACTDGLERWCIDMLGEHDPWSSVSGRRLSIYDYRTKDRPDAERITNLSRLTDGAVDWYQREHTAASAEPVDLAILSHLGMLAPALIPRKTHSALSDGGLVRHRMRHTYAPENQEMVIVESRASGPTPRPAKAALLNQMQAIQQQMEAGLDGKAFKYSPDWITLEEVSTSARYCAVSSADSDPSTFSRPDQASYLWDYDVPALSRHGMQDSGYYLIARDASEAIAAVQSTFKEISEGIALDEEVARALLAEVSNRGVPSLKNLASGGTIARGEVGMLATLQLLQPSFSTGDDAHSSCFPPKVGETINLLVPVDPFLDQINALRRSLTPKVKAARPDLMAISITGLTDTAPPSIRITPIEVKCRWEKLDGSGQKKAHSQAQAMVELLNALQEKLTLGKEAADAETTLSLWDLAGRGLLTSWLDFGFRIYARSCPTLSSENWAAAHNHTLHALMGGTAQLEIASVGRVFVVHHTSHSQAHDRDQDGFGETFEVSWSTVTELLDKPAQRPVLAEAMYNLVHDWKLWAVADDVHGHDPTIPPEAEEDDGLLEDATTEEVAELPSPSPNPHVPTTQPSVGDDIPAGEEPTAVPNTPVSSSVQPRPELPEGGAEPVATDGAPQAPTEGPPLTTQDTAMWDSILDLPHSTSTGNAGVDGDGVRFVVGEVERTLKPRPVFFHPSNTKLSHLNLGIVGDMGTGKTQLSKYLITQMCLAEEENRGHSPRFLIFDYKKDYSQADFVHAVGANVVPPEDIPLNIMALPPRTDGKSHKRRDWVKQANFLNDTLKRIYSNIGPKQEARLKKAVIDAYQAVSKPGHFPVLNDVYARYEESGAPDSVSSILSNIIDMEIFTDDPTAVVGFNEFLSGVTVIELHKLGSDQKLKNTLVVFFLNFFYDFMIRQKKQPYIGKDPQLRFIEAMMLVDEADNIMKYNFGVLRQILQEGREFGVGVLLASQYLSHFKTSDYDYREPLLTWFIHRVPNLQPRDVEGLGLSDIDPVTVSKIKSLDNHEFFCTTLGEEGTFAKGRTFWRMYQAAWEDQNEAILTKMKTILIDSPEHLASSIRKGMRQQPPDVKQWLDKQKAAPS